MRRLAIVLLALLAALARSAAHAELRVTDDSGRTVSLAAPARRVISLGPHLTELAYAAGGGAAVLGSKAHCAATRHCQHSGFLAWQTWRPCRISQWWAPTL